jgi:hypothetical protein
MALIQAVKELTPIRRFFHERRFRVWLQKRLGVRHTEAIERAVDAEIRLVRLIADDDPSAFYDVELEYFVSNLKSAGRTIVDNPITYQDLLLILACFADRKDINRLMTEGGMAPMLGLRVHQPLVDTFAVDPVAVLATAGDALADTEAAADRQARIDARNRIRYQIDQAADAFYIATGARWKMYLQIASFLLSTLLAATALSTRGGVDQNLGGLVVGSAIAGFLAPVARDLLAALQKLRQ